MLPGQCPANDFASPVTHLPAREIYDQLTLKVMHLRQGEILQVDPGCASRDGGAEWIPLVIAHVGDARFHMTPAAAREVAVRVAGNLQFSVVFGDAPKVGLLFSEAADKAEALAAGQTPSHPMEMH